MNWNLSSPSTERERAGKKGRENEIEIEIDNQKGTTETEQTEYKNHKAICTRH